MSFDPVIALSSLNGTNGFKISGASGGELSGFSVASAGDINGDGFDDLIIGAPHSGLNGSRSGASYVVFGTSSAFDLNLNLSTLDGTNGFKISGVAAGDYSGFSVASAGDVNGDGFDDLIIGATGADPNGRSSSGATYVVFGKASGFTSNLDLSTLNGSNGFKISGVAADDYSGFSVASAGDVNGDGYADLIIGAKSADPNGTNSGASYVVFGKASGFSSNLNLSSLTGSNGFKISGASAGDYSGISVASAGDVNGDGFDDLIIGATGAVGDDPTGIKSGAAYVVYGKASGFSSNLNLSTLTAVSGFKISGEVAYDSTGDLVPSTGISVAPAGDVNGDGFDDVIVGAFRAGPSGGTAYVVFGTLGLTDLSVTDLDGTNGFKLTGEAGGNWTGYSVGSAGDVNGDGFDDLIIGAFRADPNGSGSGSTYVVFGSPSFDANIDLSTLDGTTGFRLDGEAAKDFSGHSVASAGDLNGDGFDDLIIGAYRADPAGSSDTSDFGATYVVFGGPSDGPPQVALTGTSGDNVFAASAGAETFVGLDGSDTVSYGKANAGLTASLLNPATNTGYASGDNYNSIENLVGSRLNDKLTGNDGDNVLEGGAGADQLNGGNGSDTASYLHATAGVTADLTKSSNNRGEAAGDTYNSIENLLGSQFDDRLVGNSAANSLQGGGGKDTLVGNGGDDILAAGTGNDSLSGGAGNDTYVFKLGDGSDTITEGGGLDTIHIDTNGAPLSALNAFDSSTSTSSGNLVLQYNAEQITVTSHFSGSNNVVENISFDGASYLGYQLGSGNYVINSADPADSAGARKVDLSLSSANNFIAGESGTANFITGGSGNDIVFGGTKNDVLSGGAGNDLLVGNAGGDTLNGGVGDDALAGGAGNDTLNGGTGADVFVWNGEALSAANADTILGYIFSEGDKINLQTLVPTLSAGLAIDYIHVVTSGSNLLVQVDVDGTNAGANFVTAYTLTGADTIGADTVRLSFGGQSWTITDTNVVASVADPIVLDLGAKGISFTSFSDGVHFDMNGDGMVDQVAWTTGTDGFLAYDLNGSGAIENGSELLSPFFAGGSFSSSLTALTSLDSNSDGVIDTSDVAFADLLIWQDQNHDGISDAGELSTLSDSGLAALSLDASASQSYVDGQAILSEGSFTFDNGKVGTFVEVALDTQLGTTPSSSDAAIAGASTDTMTDPHSSVLANASPANFQHANGADHGLLSAHADSLVFADNGHGTLHEVASSAEAGNLLLATGTDSLVFADASQEPLTDIVSADDLGPDSSQSNDTSSTASIVEHDADVMAPDVDAGVIVQPTTSHHYHDMIV